MPVTADQTVREVLNQITQDPRYGEVMHVPVFCWPQIALTVIALGTFALSCFGYLTAAIPLWLAIALNVGAVYLAFTPMHDGAHRSVSGNSWFNEFLGTAAGQILLPGMNMPAFRAIHMDHHRFVGQEGRDPDIGLVDVPRWAGISYLMFADLHWLFWFFKNGRLHWSPRIRRYVYIMMATVIGLHALFLLSPYWLAFLLLYVVPQRLGLGLVAYTFAYIQHPHGLTWEREPFQATVQIYEASPLRGLMFGQENHHIHHLLPHLPWHRYAHVWRLANGVLREQAVPERGWIKPAGEIYVPTDEAARPIEMRVAEIKDVSADIRSFEFEPVDGKPLPSGAAGAHIVVHLPQGLVRHYSLVGHDDYHNRYRIAVKREEDGRGGSKAMHALARGDSVRIGRPRNNFVLYEHCEHFVLVAGGIGITPLLAMAGRLQRLGKTFELHVCARSDAAVPFRDELLDGSLATKVRVHLDDAGSGRSTLDPDDVLARPHPNKLLYICGPQGFMDWLRQAAAQRGWDNKNIRIESFTAPIADDADNHGFDLTLAKSGKTIRVAPDMSILDCLQHSGVEVPYACMQGTCGTCVTEVAEGEVDHRDAFLTESEKAANTRLCLCVSRAAGERLAINI